MLSRRRLTRCCLDQEPGLPPAVLPLREYLSFGSASLILSRNVDHIVAADGAEVVLEFWTPAPVGWLFQGNFAQLRRGDVLVFY